ncbi:molybdate transport system substrate-binding protein [Nocardioides terrae]|uniref:Molybdate transport system substrate-binding protein n=1 Tax=Nocardioides terrae TaxID=574651 RepID=A0A1I1DVH5_9ACTN|nr:molybdate ABC transporter substrate-binding protein [Nocardioides terrae]SFB78881.1 molybdate transport system substrate-binding protein [Nocardioides terrae]
MKRLALALSALALVAPLAACGGSEDSGGGDSADSTTLTVFAAASLTATFTELGHEFEADHDGTTVRLSFGGSSDLVEQIRSGAPADVVASADTATMDKLGDDAVDPEDFASNTLEIAVPPGNPAHVTSLADLAGPGVKLVICAPEVPCGTATAVVAQKAGVTLQPVSQEQSVTDVLGKVSSGEADAGVVYVTDVKAAGDDVEGVTFPESSSVVNTYPIATVKGSRNADAAREFVDFVLSDDGQKMLAGAGFGKP